MKKILSLLLVTILAATLFIGCGSKTEEIKLPNVDKQISNGEIGKIFDYSTYEVTTKGDNKTINVTLAYNGEVLRIGVVNGIRNIIERDLGKDYNKIDLTIMQEKPKFDSVSYTYTNGKWDKEVS